MQGAENLAPVLRPAAPRVRVVGAPQLRELAAARVPDHGRTGHVEGVLQAHLSAGSEAEPLGWRVFPEILLLDVQLPGKGDPPGPRLRVLWVVDRLEFLLPAFGVVLDDQPQGPQHRHDPAAPAVEVFPEEVLQQGDIHGAVDLGYPDALAESPDRFGGVAPAAQTRDRRHPGVIPAPDVPLGDQGEKPAFAQHGVAQVESGKLDLLRVAACIDVLQKPVVERPVVLELQGADRMGDALQGIGKRMSVVVHRIDAPAVPGAVMRGMLDAVHRRIPQVEVRGAHIDPGPQNELPFSELSGTHAPEQVEVFLHRPVPVRAVPSGLGQSAAMLPHLFGTEAVHVRLAVPYQLFGESVQPLEVVRGVEQPLLPVVAQPAHVRHDRLDVLELFFCRIRVVKTQVALPPELLGDPEVQDDGLGVADVQVPVGFRRKARVNPAAVLAGPAVSQDDAADEIRTRCLGSLAGRTHGCRPGRAGVIAVLSRIAAFLTHAVLVMVPGRPALILAHNPRLIQTTPARWAPPRADLFTRARESAHSVLGRLSP